MLSFILISLHSRGRCFEARPWPSAAVTKSDTSTVTRVPFLGYIPLIGELFTHRAKGKASSELLLLITPALEHSDTEGSEITKEP